jgi:hypothetical protein
VMQGFRSPCGLQRFVSLQSATRNSFSVPAHRCANLQAGRVNVTSPYRAV